MASIAHPENEGEQVEVTVVDTEEHRGHEMAQVEAVDENVSLSDPSGEQPWVFAEDVEGL